MQVPKFVLIFSNSLDSLLTGEEIVTNCKLLGFLTHYISKF